MRIMIAGHDVHVRRALRLLFEYEEGIELVEEVSTADKIAEQAESFLPQLVVLDWELKGLRREEVILQLKNIHSSPFVVALGSQPKSKNNSLELGVDAFISRWQNPQDVLNIIRRVYEEDNNHRQQVTR